MKGISFLLISFLMMACSTVEKSGDPIKDLTDAKSEKFNQCYYESDLYTGKKPGQVKAIYRINPEGKIERPKMVEANFKDPNLIACVDGILKSINYPPREDGKSIDVVYPFHFSPDIAL